MLTLATLVLLLLLLPLWAETSIASKTALLPKGRIGTLRALLP